MQEIKKRAKSRTGGKHRRDVGKPVAGEVSIPPRVRRVMVVLLTGATEKQAARQLGLSVHTVHAYTTMLYRAMGVNSRAELLVRCLTRPDEDASNDNHH
jgi:DNA-binding NarL/FixJ family response regulator